MTTATNGRIEEIRDLRIDIMSVFPDMPPDVWIGIDPEAYCLFNRHRVLEWLNTIAWIPPGKERLGCAEMAHRFATKWAELVPFAGAVYFR